MTGQARGTQAGSKTNNRGGHALKARNLGIAATPAEAIAVMPEDCSVCRSEGLTARTSILVEAGKRAITARLLHSSDRLIAAGEIGLSNEAWTKLGLRDGDHVMVRHPPPVASLSALRKRVYGNRLSGTEFADIVTDLVAGKYSDVHLASFVTACSAFPLDLEEMIGLTRAMVDAGQRLSWPQSIIVDKHSVGGLPGNRTTPIVVSIVAALGLVMPKTSSRAITSPAGTADTMETLAPVDLDIRQIRDVVSRQNACLAWGGAVQLSPADDIIIGVERVLDLDSTGQLVASVLSKKIAAGATHLVIDMPVGPTAKVRTPQAADELSYWLETVAAAFRPGDQPIGRGIGPALEARDVLAVLQQRDAPADLAARACELAGALLELAQFVPDGKGTALARQTLQGGQAWQKFQAICEAQGGMRQPPESTNRQIVRATKGGVLGSVDNRRLAKLAKLAGAPAAKAAGVELHCRLGDVLEPGAELCTVHAESDGELAYAMQYFADDGAIFGIDAP
jgi:thymidine phosphorylase